MAFLDNSGDIILDAVLTDTGRKRLAQGDGSFRITQFAFGDDEINYALYRNSNHASGAHPSGSAYYDLEIMQTPILEAFTNNTSLMKSKLMSIGRTNILYLPELLLNMKENITKTNDPTGVGVTTKVFVFTVDEDTAAIADIYDTQGVLNGYDPGADGAPASTKHIRLDQGLDTDEISPSRGLSPDLLETQYIIEMDTRLGNIIDHASHTPLNFSFVDDDNIASYIVALGDGTSAVERNNNTGVIGEAAGVSQVIRGPRGTSLRFSLMASTELTTSDYLFTKLGGTMTASGLSNTLAATDLRYIDTNVRITGVTTGYSVDVPVRFIKKQ